jgi:asparagine synthase (glutamine-hydrolysing)
MCGITGASWTSVDRAIDLPTLQRMTDSLRHRGPDADGTYFDELRLQPPHEAMPGIALGHRRLSIIDLATGGQPMCNEDGSVWTVFNGEAYNYRELRVRLEAAGHKFRTDSDTETIIHLYEEEGPDCFSHLNGMFAIALWDANRRRLVLARDRLGKKPLVYRHEPGRLLFASELKSLLEVSGLPREIDPAAIDEYLTYQYIPHPKTVFRGFQKLPPGHYAVFQDDRLEIRPFWQPDFAHERRLSERDAVEELRELLNSAVRIRMRSDVPLGAFLSGGVDSSIIVALMQQQSAEPVKTFTIGFPVKEYDETPYADRVARHLKTDHRVLEVKPDALDILPKLAYHYDEPFADSSAIPTWYVSELTRRHVTVALSGDGGDELFAGYNRYLWTEQLAHAVKAMPQSLRHASAMALRALAPQTWDRLFALAPASWRPTLPGDKLHKIATVLDNPTPDAIYRRLVSQWERPEEVAAAGREPDGPLWDATIAADFPDLVARMQFLDMVTYLPDDILTKVDRATMAVGLEGRVPLLDHRVVSYAWSLPRSLKLRGGHSKWLLRRVLERYVPSSLTDRPKMGFGVPIDAWLRGPLREWAESLLAPARLTSNGFVRVEPVRKAWQEHIQGARNWQYPLWTVLMLQAWRERWA